MSEPQTVFLVEHGEYSDRYVVGVFSTRQLAEEYCAAKICSPSFITEMVINAERLILHDWVCVLSYETGEQVACEQKTSEQHWCADAKLDPNRNLIAAWGQSAEHAVKSAADFLAQRISNAVWELGWEKERAERIKHAAEAGETSEWIAQRNAETGTEDSSVRFDWGEDRVNVTIDPLPDFAFVAPTQDTKAMMDPFYDMWVAGAK